MCLIALAWRAHPRFELVLAANRDEFHHRASAPAAFWREAPDVFAGRDLVQGGSWLALSTRNRVAAVTNVRRMQPVAADAPSRGSLVGDFVRGDADAAAYAASLRAAAERFAGYNLLLLDGQQALFVTNQPEFRIEPLAPGVQAVSNATLNTPWPKLRQVREGLATWAARGDEDTEPLLQLLADDQPAPDEHLPDTGVGRELERFLSSPFIRGEQYGTRCSTLLTMRPDGHAAFLERRFGPNGLPEGETTQSLRLQTRA